MVEATFIQLSIIIILVLAVSIIMRLLKQPLIIGYIVSGIIAGPYLFDLIKSEELISPFANLGVAMLLFLVGLNLNPKVIKEIGFVSLITGIGQVLFTSIIGFLILKSLGFTTIVSAYVAIALTFSSTIIITKLLSDKGDLDSLYGKISVGFLIVQDLIAVFILMAVSSFSSGNQTYSLILETFITGAGLILVVFLIGIYLIPPFTKKIARSQEFLLLFSLGWCLAISSIFYALNFSFEVGALLAGMTLALSPFRYEIGSKLKPLRDFFIILFFVLLGSKMVFTDFSQYLVPIILLSLFILIGNPIIVLSLMGILGYTKRTGFLAGLTVAQVSEFSLILVALGAKLGQLSNEIVSMVAVISLITFAGSTYLIIYSNQIYKFISPVLSIFEKSNTQEKKETLRKNYKAILFGYNRIGFSLIKSFEKIKEDCLVVDFNPETIKKLEERKINSIYGDATDLDFLEDLDLKNVNLIVSTIPEKNTNMLILKNTRESSNQPIIILMAHNIEDALDFYKEGADYVILPHFVGGDHISEVVTKFKYNRKEYQKLKSKHLKSLNERLDEGHSHPKVERN